MRMGQGVRTVLGHGGITCVLQTQFSSSCICCKNPPDNKDYDKCESYQARSFESLKTISYILPLAVITMFDSFNDVSDLVKTHSMRQQV